MRPAPRGFAGRLALLLVAALVVAQGLGFALFARERVTAYREAYREGVAARLVSLVRLIEDSPAELHDRIAATATSSSLRAALTDEPQVPENAGPGGEAVAARLAAVLARPVEAVRVEIAGEPLWQRGDGDEAARPPPHRRRARWLAASVRIEGGRWLNAATERPRVPPLGAAFLASLLLSALAVAAVAALAARHLALPLRRLADAADRLGRGEAVQALPEDGPEETRRTVRAFNRMRERLDRFVRDRTTMLGAVAHDLRTPITTLRLHAEFVQDEDTRAKMIGTLDEMQALAEAGLAFAKGDAAGEPTRATDLAALVESVVEDLAAQGLDVALEGEAEQAERVVLPCRPLALRRALTNLVENATRYGGAARVRVTRRGQEVHVEVEDRGPGIAQAELERVFEPFVRLEASRGRETGGAGLGLAIARSTVRSHGGDVRLENMARGGLRAVVVLPGPG